MKTIPAAALALTLGAALGIGALATYASWEDRAGLSVSVRSGAIHFAVDDPKDSPDELQAIERAGDLLVWNLPAGEEGRTPGYDGLPGNILGNLSPAAPQSAVIRIDGQSQGNRGLAYSLAKVEVNGDDRTFADLATVKIGKVSEPADCSPRNVGDVLYSGKLSGARFDPRELVPAKYSETGWDAPATEYLCLGFSLNTADFTYKNTATATGTTEGGLEPEIKLKDHDSWETIVEPTAEQRAAKVEFTFKHQTYRPADQP